MITHDVWQETIIPRPAKPITTKWIFRPKCDINGNILSNTKLVSLLAVLNKFTAETSMKPTVLYFVYFLHSQASFHWYCFKWMWKRPFWMHLCRRRYISVSLKEFLFSIPTMVSVLNAPCMALNNLFALGTMISINHWLIKDVNACKMRAVCFISIRLKVLRS